MKKKTIALVVGTVLVAPFAHADVDLAGKAVQMYSKIHVSLDSYDRGQATVAVPDPKDTEVASNSSRIGFKGEFGFNDTLKAIWKFESGVDFAGESGTLSARNRFVGLKGGFGAVTAGIHDTPLKSVGGAYTLFGDTVGDRRSILGQTPGGDNQFNQRAKNMLMYQGGGDAVKVKLMYANDFEDVTDPDQSKNKLTGASVEYKGGGFKIGVGYEKQADIDGTPNKDATATRVGAKFKLGSVGLGLIYEDISDDGYGPNIERSAYGVNASFKMGKMTKLALQHLVADTSKAVGGNDGASQTSVGIFHKLAKPTEVYVMFATLDNDPAASYRLARSGHGQSFNPTQAGESVDAISVGLIHKF